MIKRRSILYLIVSVLLSGVVYAAEEGSITSIFKTLGDLIGDVSSLGEAGFKFLLLILLFALTNFGLKKARFDPKTAGIISFIFSLGSILLIRGEIIQYIFGMYGILVVFLLGVLVPLFVGLAIHASLEGNSFFVHAIRGFLYVLIGVFLIVFSVWIKSRAILSVGM